MHRLIHAGDVGWRGRRVSRDGKRLALGGWHIVTVDIASGDTELAAGSKDEGRRQLSGSPVWARGDIAVAYVRSRTTVERVDLRSSEIRTLFEGPKDSLEIWLTDWSSDGNFIAFERVPASGAATREAWEYDLSTSKMGRMFDAAGHESEMHYAPAGGWIAYQSTVSGESNVFLRPHPGGGEPIRVSSAGGRFPRWRADGAELFYIAPDGAVMAVRIQLGPTPKHGAAHVALPASAIGDRRVDWFAAAPDGRRFYFDLRSEVSSLTLVLNWWALLEPRPAASR